LYLRFNLNVSKTIAKIKNKFFCSIFGKDVEQWIESCPNCTQKPGLATLYEIDKLKRKYKQIKQDKNKKEIVNYKKIISRFDKPIDSKEKRTKSGRSSKQTNAFDSNKLKDFIFEEIQGDLFSVKKNFALAHCVSNDFEMGSGIAKSFKEKFGKVNKLKSQKCKIGDCAYLKLNNRYIFYLITKNYYYEKPTYDNLRSSLEKMKDLILRNNIYKLAIPKIGCGIDKLDWAKVRGLLIETFEDTPIHIQVYSL
jgi:O-acetyl-ADP-ribose deacetylase (regulator of RNase III)